MVKKLFSIVVMVVAMNGVTSSFAFALTKQSVLLKERLPRLLRNLAMTDRTKRKDCRKSFDLCIDDQDHKHCVIPECFYRVSKLSQESVNMDSCWNLSSKVLIGNK
jgi:hypothetical protein